MKKEVMVRFPVSVHAGLRAQSAVWGMQGAAGGQLTDNVVSHE